MFRALLLIALPLCPVIAGEEMVPIREQYTTLRTVAGTGIDDDQNFWIPGFEGADPRTVELSNPHATGTDAFGRIYIVDKESHSVLRISADGKTLSTVAGTHVAGDGGDEAAPATEVALDNPNGLYVFADGGFLILDTGNGKIREVDAQGQCETLLTYAPGFGAGRGLTVTRDPSRDTLYFCGEIAGDLQNVMGWKIGSATPPFVVDALPPGANGLGNIDLMYGDGFLGVTSVGDHRVYRVHVAGTVPTEVIAGTGGTDGGLASESGEPALAVALDRVRGIAFRPDGSYFLATQKGGDVWWVDLEGIIHLVVEGADRGNVRSGDGQPLTGDGEKIAEPRHVHLASTGELLLTTNDNGYIRSALPACPPPVPEIEVLRTPEGFLARWSNASPGSYTVIQRSADLVTWETGVVLAPGESSFRRDAGPGTRFWRAWVPRAAE